MENFAARTHSLKLSERNTSMIQKIKNTILDNLTLWNWEFIPYNWKMFYYERIKTIFKPQNQRLRKSIPRQWRDISHLMVDVNFEFIKVFYEDEYKADIVDWEATEHHKEFAEWLEKVYLYITKERPQLEIDLQNAYPLFKGFDDMFKPIEKDGKRMFEMVDDGIPYDVKYKEVNRIEKLINDIDTEVLIEFVKRRDFFWT